MTLFIILSEVQQLLITFRRSIVGEELYLKPDLSSGAAMHPAGRSFMLFESICTRFKQLSI